MIQWENVENNIPIKGEEIGKRASQSGINFGGL
jgi:hypothetical protein